LISTGLAREVDPEKIEHLYEHCIQVAEETRRAAPSYPKTLFDLGEVHERFGFDDRAIETYREGLRMDPEHRDPRQPKVLSKIAFLLRQRKQDEAAETYRKALEIDPTYPGMHSGIGLIYYHQGRLKEAVRECREEIHNRTANYLTYHILGQALRDLEKYQPAILSFQEAIRMDPRGREAYYGLWQVYKVLGRRKEELATLEKFSKLKEEEDRQSDEITTKGGDRPKRLHLTALTYLDAAQTYRDLKQPDRTVDALRNCLRFDPSLLDVRRLLAETLRQQGRIDEAIEECQRCLKEKRTPDTLFLLAGLLTLKGLHGQAGSLLEEAIRLDPGMDGAYRELAKLVLKGQIPGGAARGLELARSAAERAPFIALNYDIYSWALFLSGRPEESMKNLEIAVRLDPANPGVRQRYEQMRKMLREQERKR